MKNRKQRDKVPSVCWKFLGQMIFWLIAYTISFLPIYLMAKEIYLTFLFSETSGIFYHTLFWMETHKLFCILLYLLVGYSIIFSYYWKKPYGFLKEVLNAAQKIYESGDQLIELSEPLKDAEFFMNQLKIKIQNSERAEKEAEQRKNDLITYLAHDLKTPLTSVIGYLSLLDEVRDMPEKQKEKYVAITLEKAKRLEQLINEFFEITRYNLQQIILEKEMLDLSYMLIQMSDEFYPILKNHNNTMKLDIDENLTICADPQKLARVFQNILKNAIAYSHPGTEIEIEAKSKETEVTIFFRNHGKTIPKQKLETIFEKFFRLDDARMTNTGGAGLGLAIAKEIVTLHGGVITAESANGLTVFCVKLPID